MSNPREATIPTGICACGHRARFDERTECRFCQCDEHLAARAAYRGNNPQEPPGAEAALDSYSAALEEATELLRQARDDELDAEEARDAAKRRAQLSPDCPKVGVFGGVRTTVDYVKAWIEEQIATEESAYKAAKVARQAASAHLDKLNSQRSIQQTIAKSVTAGYQGTGERW